MASFGVLVVVKSLKIGSILNKTPVGKEALSVQSSYYFTHANTSYTFIRLVLPVYALVGLKLDMVQCADREVLSRAHLNSL